MKEVESAVTNILNGRAVSNKDALINPGSLEYFERIVMKSAAGQSREAIAMTYPRETWYLRMAIAIMNFFQRLRNDPFRMFVHPVHEMETLLNGEGLRKISVRRLFVWEMALYQRVI